MVIIPLPGVVVVPEAVNPSVWFAKVVLDKPYLIIEVVAPLLAFKKYEIALEFEVLTTVVDVIKGEELAKATVVKLINPSVVPNAFVARTLT